MANRILKELKTFTENPAPRSGHRCCATVNHLLVYGGYDKACNDHIYSEILSFNTISRKWTELPHSRNVRFQSASSSMVIYGNSLIIFGGSGYPFGHSNTNDLSVYSLRSKTWSQFRHVKKGNPPIPKYGHSMVISTHKENPKLYIFSGTIGREFLDDMHCFDLESKTWNDIWEEDAPEARYRHEAVVYGDDFYVFGGATYGRALNFHDIWKFNFTSHKWSKLECKPSSKGLFPAPRKAHSCVVWKDTVYMCGGIGHPPEPYNDIWKINLKELKWSKLDIVSLLPYLQLPSRNGAL